ncbi:MAG: fasciclin domain-containing protein [Prolixibacteraceae bacterium]
MKKQLYISIVILLFAGIYGCEDNWNEHYMTKPATVDVNFWDALKENADASKFVELIESYHLDSLFEYNNAYTLFVPTNQAFETYLTNNSISEEVLDYHILRYFIQPNDITGKRKIQTLMLKFAQFENNNGSYTYDEIPVSFTSPLYSNGRFFIIDEVASPKPSLYEYIAENNPALKRFIDLQDSIVLDKELSKPLGFDENGNTVYDSVITIINLFEEEYFKVSEEFRLKTATLVFPKKELYQQALTQMALKIGAGYETYADISEEWQEEVLIPYLIEEGMFANMLEPDVFRRDSIQNILGDYVKPKFFVTDRTLCSNGYAYDYSNFEILDSLFMSPLRNEGETLLKVIGKDRFTWKEEVIVKSDQTFVPNADYVNTASNDSILKVEFPSKYEGQFSVEFLTKPLFPRRYLMVVRTHMDFGGLYEIYVNDELVKTFDYYDFIRLKGVVPSAVTGKRFIADGRYNKFDFWVDNITSYGKAKVRFEYKGPSSARYNGFMLDYLDCVPEGQTDDITKNP